jgi:hypothetical protein
LQREVIDVFGAGAARHILGRRAVMMVAVEAVLAGLFGRVRGAGLGWGLARVLGAGLVIGRLGRGGGGAKSS